MNMRETADPKALDLCRNSKHVGSLQWHPEREPRVVLTEPLGQLTLTEMKELVKELEARVWANRPWDRMRVKKFYEGHMECFVEPFEQCEAAVDEIFDRYVDVAENESFELSQEERDQLYEMVYAGVF